MAAPGGGSVLTVSGDTAVPASSASGFGGSSVSVALPVLDSVPPASVVVVVVSVPLSFAVTATTSSGRSLLDVGSASNIGIPLYSPHFTELSG